MRRRKKGRRIRIKKEVGISRRRRRNNGAIGENGPNWKDVDEDCGLVVEGKEETEKKERLNIG